VLKLLFIKPSSYRVHRRDDGDACPDDSGFRLDSRVIERCERLVFIFTTGHFTDVTLPPKCGTTEMWNHRNNTKQHPHRKISTCLNFLHHRRRFKAQSSDIDGPAGAGRRADAASRSHVLTRKHAAARRSACAAGTHARGRRARVPRRRGRVPATASGRSLAGRGAGGDDAGS
jgi:hypothetical protein